MEEEEDEVTPQLLKALELIKPEDQDALGSIWAILRQEANGVTRFWQYCADGHREALLAIASFLNDILVNTPEAHMTTTIRELVNWRRKSDLVCPLYIAAQNGHLDACRILLGLRDAKGARIAEINMSRDTNATPLFIATQNNHVEIVSLLLGAGADVSIENSQNCTPFVLACSMGHTEIALLLFHHGSDWCHVGTGMTGLDWCARHRHRETRKAIAFLVLRELLPDLLRKAVYTQWSKRAIESLEEKRREIEAEEARNHLLTGGKLPSLWELKQNNILVFPFDLLDVKPMVKENSNLAQTTFVVSPSLEEHPRKEVDARKSNIQTQAEFLRSLREGKTKAGRDVDLGKRALKQCSESPSHPLWQAYSFLDGLVSPKEQLPLASQWVRSAASPHLAAQLKETPSRGRHLKFSSSPLYPMSK